MDRYIAFIQNELLIVILVVSLVIVIIDPLYQVYSQYCIVNESETVYEGFYGRIVRNYKVVEPC